MKINGWLYIYLYNPKWGTTCGLALSYKTQHWAHIRSAEEKEHMSLFWANYFEFNILKTWKLNLKAKQFGDHETQTLTNTKQKTCV